MSISDPTPTFRRRHVGSGGRTERLIFLFTGGILGGLGLFMGWLAYRWAVWPISYDYKHLWIAGAGTLSLVMLRGALVIILKKQDDFIDLNSAGR